MSEIVYRPLELADAADLAPILADVWHKDAQGEAHYLHGLIDLAIYAQQPTWTQVAQMDGRAVGVVMARAGKPSPEAVEPWRKVEQDAWGRLRELPDGRVAELESYFADAATIDAELLAESGCDPAYELVLFAVSSETRGHGVGSTLLGAAQEYLREQGATHAFLYTDTDCTWQYYEHRGMKRKAERVLSANGEDAMFVYEMDL